MPHKLERTPAVRTRTIGFLPAGDSINHPRSNCRLLSDDGKLNVEEKYRLFRRYGQDSFLGGGCIFHGFQRRIGFRAAATSSRRPTRVECGAVFTRLGSSSVSAAIERIASMNKSHSSLDSDSVGSIIIAPGTISGNAVV